ncbi:MAG: NACHT domain-containing protein [Thermodesulfovibrionia bacterium]|nr:NACHT domain-containing protein [Thermodesulfovibrionia bacterium]
MLDIDEIICDICAFADPFTEQKTRKLKNSTQIELIRNGRKITYEIAPDLGRFTAKHRERSFSGIASLIASDEFANLHRFAQTQLRSFQDKSKIPPIPTEIDFEGQRIALNNLSAELCNTNVNTRLILIDGPAGVGKTYYIERLVQGQAEKMMKGQVSPLVLHVSSRGRRLSNLRDVLAATTQDYAAEFGARHVPILVRHGLLVAAIDGFDELVDADGYEDSWSALREFVGDVKERGTIILAARDTFVEEQELLARINSASNVVALSMAHIRTITPSAAKDWLLQNSKWKPAEVNSETTDYILIENSYALRPFFLRILWDAGKWERVLDIGPRTFLVNHFIEREAKLIAKQIEGLTPEIITPALISLFQEVALEMTSREVDTVEMEHLTFLARYCFEGTLNEGSIRKLMHKAGSFALLEQSNQPGHRRFSHSEIMQYFLGGALVSALAAKTVPSVLRRAVIGAEHAEVFFEVFVNDEDKAKKAAQFLSSAISSEISMDRLHNNGGTILTLAFSAGLLERLDYLEVVDASMAGGAPEGEVSSSNFARLDVCGADFSHIEFTDVAINTLVVDDTTRFGSSLPKITQLEIRSDGIAKIERDPSQISQFIASHSIASSNADYLHSALIKLLERVARRAARFFYLREHGDDDEYALLLKDPNWQVVKSVLIQHKRIDVVTRKSMHGRPAPLLRIKNPKDLLDWSIPETIAIFNDLIGIKGARVAIAR